MTAASEPRRLAGYKHLIDMPGDGPWKMCVFGGSIIVASAEHGTFILHASPRGPIWQQISDVALTDEEIGAVRP